MTKKYDIRDYQWTTEDIQQHLGYNRQYVRVLAKSGKLPAIKRFRQWMFCKAEVEAYFGEQGKQSTVGAVNDEETTHADINIRDLL